MTSRIWFITGSSTGFGRATTEYVLEKGETVAATLRTPAALADLQGKYPQDRLLVLPLDVTKPGEIATAFAAAVARFGRVDVVFNNAGFAVQGEVEGTPEDIARRMFEVNFWGAANVTREAIRVFREVNKPRGGRLLQMSSISGVRSPSSMGYYGASKHALAGLSESLAHETPPEWNIKITVIEPSMFRTEASTKNAIITPLHPAYENSPSAQLRNSVTEGLFNGAPTAIEAAQRFYTLSLLAEPPLHLALGKLAVRMATEHYTKSLEETKQYADWSEPLSM